MLLSRRVVGRISRRGLGQFRNCGLRLVRSDFSWLGTASEIRKGMNFVRRLEAIISYIYEYGKVFVNKVKNIYILSTDSILAGNLKIMIKIKK